VSNEQPVDAGRNFTEGELSIAVAQSRQRVLRIQVLALRQKRAGARTRLACSLLDNQTFQPGRLFSWQHAWPGRQSEQQDQQDGFHGSRL
jgi:hypothetical protein